MLIIKAVFCRKGDVNTILAFKCAYTGRPGGKSMYNQQCKVQRLAGQQREASNSQETVKPIVEKRFFVA